jgi:hypothetical protein
LVSLYASAVVSALGKAVPLVVAALYELVVVGVEAAAVQTVVSPAIGVRGHIVGSELVDKSQERRHIVLARRASRGVGTAMHAGAAAEVRSGHIAVGDRRHCWRGAAEATPGGEHVHTASHRASVEGAEVHQDVEFAAVEAQARVIVVRQLAWRSTVPL